MAKDLLVEIGLEEMPAHVVTPSMQQFSDKTANFLKENRLDFESIEAFSTPRRLAVRVNGLAEKQADTEEEFKGPAKKIALDAEGNWSKAALGFVRGKGLTTDDIVFKEIKGVEYVHVTKFTPGVDAIEVLPALKEVIMNLTFPVSMTWADHDFKYIRPIKWLVALLDDEVIPFEILGVQTGRSSRGHRLAKADTTFANPSEYLTRLEEVMVIADSDKRKAIIVDQINQLAKENNWQIDLDEDLLEEVNNIVEYPTAFAGSFDKKYLAVPEEVLITSMKEHQRFFYVREKDGKLSPHFISVRNGGRDYLDNVIAGNEKVLVARLEDGEFFWKEDQKLDLQFLVDKLAKVTFHEKIGNLSGHMARTKVIAGVLANKLSLSDDEKKDLLRAADSYKFDLVTNMVGEFPELQGIMGEKYALLAGEDKAVGQAIREHYMPISAEGELPESTVGAILAVSDKLESIYSFFTVGLIPSGSNDPYALRRAASGIVRIFEEKGWNFDFSALQDEIFTAVNVGDFHYAAYQEAIDFLKARVKQNLTAHGIRHDIVDAVLAGSSTNIAKMLVTASLLMKHTQDPDFKGVIESLGRILNLAKKVEDESISIAPNLFENKEEKDLYEAFKQLKANAHHATSEELYQGLASLRGLIEAYFENTMVMTDNTSVKNNRLAQLKAIADLILKLGSLDLIIVK